MTIQVIVLNGGSSSGKSAIVQCLQEILPDPWLSLSVDTLVYNVRLRRGHPGDPVAARDLADLGHGAVAPDTDP